MKRADKRARKLRRQRLKGDQHRERIHAASADLRQLATARKLRVMVHQQVAMEHQADRNMVELAREHRVDLVREHRAEQDLLHPEAVPHQPARAFRARMERLHPPHLLVLKDPMHTSAVHLQRLILSASRSRRS